MKCVPIKIGIYRRQGVPTKVGTYRRHGVSTKVGTHLRLTSRCAGGSGASAGPGDDAC